MSNMTRLNALLPQVSTSDNSKAIDKIKTLGISKESSLGGANSGVEGTSFSELLKSALNGVNDAQLEADNALQSFLQGESTDIADTMIALSKASVSLNMMLEVRNKILEAYQEVMRTQV